MVGTKNTSSSDAPKVVLRPNTSSTDPAINTAIAQASRNAASGAGIPLEAMNAAVPAKSVSLEGSAFTNTAAISTRPMASNHFAAFIRSAGPAAIDVVTVDANQAVGCQSPRKPKSGSITMCSESDPTAATARRGECRAASLE